MSGKKCRLPLEGIRKIRRYETQQAERALADTIRARRVQKRKVEAARRHLRVSTQQDARQIVCAELVRLGECQQEEARHRAAARERWRAENLDDLTKIGASGASEETTATLWK